MNASIRLKNPRYKGSLEGKDLVCKGKHRKKWKPGLAEYESGGAEVVKGFLVYTLNGGQKSEEVHRKQVCGQ